MNKSKVILASFCILHSFAAHAQKLWTENDRKYLLDSLISSRNLLMKETENLSNVEWNFKESPGRWSIKEVVEHIGIWELLLAHEVSKALSAGPQLELNKTVKPDSIFYRFIMEEKPHISVEYTKPFTYTLPIGLNDGKNSIAWFLKMRNESIEWLKIANEDLRSYYLKPGRPNIHQVYITTYGHTLRHIRQIQKIKINVRYPRS
ncbi:MAG TPA: DinB family protein [Flavitalea sp.]|nr:DinB family protein [Flavitalea sp.]